MYPKKPKMLFTKQGQWLRKMALIFFLLDALFFVLCLAFVGFEPMTYDLFCMALGYSVYLTVREWVVFLYIIMKFAAGTRLCFGESTGSHFN